ncbi:MAG: hypothetical protein MHPSP_004926, partial [Paramarteilia canceri]
NPLQKLLNQSEEFKNAYKQLKSEIQIRNFQKIDIYSTIKQELDKSNVSNFANINHYCTQNLQNDNNSFTDLSK